MKHRARYLHLLRGCLCALSAALLWGCNTETRTPAGKVGSSPLTVAVSIPPQAYLVDRIGGEHVRVVTVMQPGENPHSYLPSDHEISEVMRADVYFRIGVPFENGKWFETVNRSKRLRMVDTREGISLREMESHKGHDREGSGTGSHVHSAGCRHEGLDPHIWLAPALLKQQATTVLRALQILAKERAADFQDNHDRLVRELDELDSGIRVRLAPLRGARVYVYHPSWGYFCDAYGLRQCAIEVEGKEPSDAQLTALQVQARSGKVKVLFVQPQIQGRSVRALAKLLDAEVRTLDPLAYDVIDGLRSAANAIAEGGP